MAVDAAAQTIRLVGKGTDTTGGSGASMDLTARLEAIDAASACPFAYYGYPAYFAGNPRASFDFFPYAGLHRPVVLYAVPREHIESLLGHVPPGPGREAPDLAATLADAIAEALGEPSPEPQPPPPLPAFLLERQRDPRWVVLPNSES